MFAEVKDALPVSGDGYDAQIINEIYACERDLTTSTEIVMPGVIHITRTRAQAERGTEEQWTVTDHSTVRDPLIIAAIATWCNMRIGNPPNYDNLLKAYESLKGQMRLSRYYSGTGEAEECGS